MSALPAKPSKVGLDVVVNTISEVVQLESVVWNVTEVARLLLVTFAIFVRAAHIIGFGVVNALASVVASRRARAVTFINNIRQINKLYKFERYLPL